MGSTDYEFRTVWRVAGTPEEVAAVLGDATALPRWWPSVYLSVEPVAGGPEPGPGIPRPTRLHTKGWLPYTLRWTLTVTEPVTGRGFALTAAGDLNGTGRWTFEPDGPETVITYDWRVSTAKPLLRRLSWLLKAGLRRQPPLGDGPRPGEPRPGAAPAPGGSGEHPAHGGRAAAVPPPPPPTFAWLTRRAARTDSQTGRLASGLLPWAPPWTRPGLVHNGTGVSHSLDH